MGLTRIYLELGVKLTSQPVLRQHALYGIPDERLGFFFEKLAGRNLFESPDVAAMTIIDLLLHFLAGQDNLVRINHDNRVPHVDMGGVERIVFSSQPRRDSGSQPSQNLALRINKVPFLIVIRRLGTVRVFLHVFKLLTLNATEFDSIYKKLLICQEETSKNTFQDPAARR